MTGPGLGAIDLSVLRAVDFRWPAWPRVETRWLVSAFAAMLALLGVLPSLL